MNAASALLRRNTSLVVMVLLMIVVEWLGPTMLTRDQIAIKVSAASTLCLIAAGETIVVLRGGIDLSIAGTMSLATAIAATRAEASFWALAPWLVVLLAIGLVVGIVNALIVSLLELQPFVVTLGTWSVTQGIALLVLPADGGLVPSAWYNLAYEEPLGVPVAVWLLLAILLAWAWARRTRTITRIRAAGSSERAARLSGVSPLAANLSAYGICGVLAACAGFVFSAQTSSGSPTVGSQFVLPAIAAVVIGGASLAGGRASVFGTIIGAFVLNLIGDVVFQLELASYWQPVASGLVLVCVVASSHLARPATGEAVT